jgi:hypothetical protein
MVESMRVNGREIKCIGLVNLNIQMVQYMRVILLMIRKRVKVLFLIQMEVDSKESLRKVKEMDQVR